MKRITGAEARELAAKATQGEWTATEDYYEWCVVGPRGMVIADTASDTDEGRANAALLAAAPALAESLAAVEAERDALRGALGEMLDAEDALRAFNSPDNATTPGPLLEYVKARAPYLERVREAWQALAALREAAK